MNNQLGEILFGYSIPPYVKILVDIVKMFSYNNKEGKLLKTINSEPISSLTVVFGGFEMAVFRNSILATEPPLLSKKDGIQYIQTHKYIKPHNDGSFSRYVSFTRFLCLCGSCFASACSIFTDSGRSHLYFNTMY